jgi:hypothetical protein
MFIVVFGCSYSGTHKSTKNVDPDVHRNKVSKRTGCPFQVIVRSPQMIAPFWHITTVNATHNDHVFNLATLEFNRHNKQISAMVYDKIASFEGRFDLDQVIYLLGKDWPGKAFHRRTVANAIQRAKIQAVRNEYSEAAELFQILQDKARKDNDWFISTELDNQGRLLRIFWMSPSQRSLYRRYRDVVLNDSTYKTNRFHMPLNVFVIVDNDGKSRLVGCSLVSGETIQDYEWILQQLLDANDNLPPHVILVDEDHAMEAACGNIIENTILMNCIWHLGHQNLNKKPPW